LVPILVRRILKEVSTTKKGLEPGFEYEVIAGARRLRAAKQLNIEEIPAKIVEMTDEEALEAQIIENIQRKDIHPIEEGLAYRKMRETGMSAFAISEKIGKSEKYVRYRLTLTNLIESAQNAFRKGKINDGLAVLISDLAPHHQKEALKYVLSEWALPTAKEMKDWIISNVYEPLKNQPWLKSKELTEEVGPCVECPPGRQSLFGEIKEGACTDLRCWTRKMAKYIEIKKAEWKEKGIDLIPIKKDYGMAEKGVLSKSQYETVGKKCGHETKGIVVEGEGMGELLTICVDPKCPVHGDQHTEYKITPKEKEERKKEREKAKKEKELADKKLLGALEKIEVKNLKEEVDTILFLAFQHASYNADRSICKRHGIEIVKTKNGDYEFKDYLGTLKTWINDKTIDEKVRLAFELLIDNGYGGFHIDLKKL